MKRSEKESFITDFSQRVDEAEMFALMSFNKLTVEQMTNFRLSLRKQGVRVRVVKNTLAKRAFEDSPYKDLAGKFEGPTLVAFGSQDPIVSAKVIWEWVKKEGFGVDCKGGVALGEVMEAEQLQALSQLPGREELLTGFACALVNAPTKFLYALQDAPRKLAYALVALKEKKEPE